jgi:hypothetical protein
MKIIKFNSFRADVTVILYTTGFTRGYSDIATLWLEARSEESRRKVVMQLKYEDFTIECKLLIDC